MTQATPLPCRQCGRLVAPPDGAGAGLPLCVDCGGTAEPPRPGAAPTRTSAPPRPPGGVGKGVAAALALVVPVVGGLAVVGIAGLGWWWWQNRAPREEIAASARPSEAAPGAAVVAVLQLETGAIVDPVRLLVARSWAARVRETPTALAEATRFAEAAVARAPDDVEALGLLVALYSQTGEEPSRASALMERVAALAPTSPHVAAASAENLLAAGESAGARAQLAACLSAVPDDLQCAEVADRLDGGVNGAALAARWPEHVGIGRRDALAGARGAKGVAALEATLRRIPGDVVLTQELARMRYAAGAVASAGELCRRLGVDAPPDVVARLAGAAIVAGDPAAALAWVTLVGEAGTPQERADLRLRRAQALVLQAQAHPADTARSTAALEATTSALELGRGDPAAIQARLLAALVVKDFAAGQRAFERLDTTGAAPGDLAGVYVARVALDVAQGVPAQSQRWMDEAVRLDPRSPDVWLWSATLAVAGQNPGGALGALRRAVAAVDVSSRDGLRTLPMRADVALLTNGLVNLVGGDASRERDLTLGLSVLDWLGGQPDRAVARIAGASGGSEDAALWALYARLLWARKDQYGAADAIARARALDGRTPAWAELARKIEAGGGN